MDVLENEMQGERINNIEKCLHVGADSSVSALGHTAECPHWDTQQCPHWDTQLPECPHWDTQVALSVLVHTAECPHWDTQFADCVLWDTQ